MLIKNTIKYLSSPLLGDGVIHGFLSRESGVSLPPFDSLNFDPRGGDPRENIRRNLELVSSAFGLLAKDLVTVNQVHGNTVFIADRDAIGRGKPDADAIITAEKDLAIGILTADCLPVLLYDRVKKVAAAVHAGWKGTLKGVSIKTIESMRLDFGSDPKDLIAALGPCIGSCCYRVKEDMLDEFQKVYGKGLRYFKRSGNESSLDIGAANVEQMISAGLLRDNISVDSPCTSCNPQFFSYRKNNNTGRQASLIMLRGAR